MRRIMLKLSGEVFRGQKNLNIDPMVIESFSFDIQSIREKNIQLAITVGGGNFWRYRDFQNLQIERSDSDSLGMLATIMNAVILRSELVAKNIPVSIFSCVSVPSILPCYDRFSAREALSRGDIVILAGGTGKPYFTTDSAAALHALELHCDELLKATKVDYVYDKDPMKDKSAKPFKKLAYNQVFEMNLAFMDRTAISLCQEGHLEIRVFNFYKSGNLMNACLNKNIGTLIS